MPERLPARPRMTADQYLTHMGWLRGLAPAAAAARSRVLLTRLALAPGPDVPIGTLPRGNCQQVALAQALLAPVRLLVLDEPDGGLGGRALAEAAPAAPAAELARMPGVLSWDHDAARGPVGVRTSDGDAFLRRALGSGW